MSTVYWPGLHKELERLVLNCEVCLKYLQAKHRQKRSEQLGQEIPATPWTKLASDLFHFDGASHLLIVDYTSRFPVIHKLRGQDGKSVISVFKQLCSEHGWPDALITDNGPCYTSQEFVSLMQAKGVNHITSSPHYPQSNGLAEKYVQLTKSLFKKAAEEGKDPLDALLIYRSTPLTRDLQSPIKTLENRIPRSDLPMSKSAQARYKRSEII